MIDEQDRRLLEQVRPPGYRNPAAARLYDLVVIGGGTAGLVCAAGAAGLGARVALIERARLGGDCLNTGCVPSKALVRSAHVLGEVRAGRSLGIDATATVDFTAVLSRLRARRADLAPADSAQRMASLGVDVFFGTAAFASDRSIVVRSEESGAQTLSFRKAVIATGSSPSAPPVAGLSGTPFLTSDSLFDLTAQPPSLAILGAGPVGCEMAQAFARFGTRVTLLDAAGQVLPREDADAAAIVSARLAADGVSVLVGTAAVAVRHGDRGFAIDHARGGLTADALLVAAGRTPRVSALGLETAGVDYGLEGVVVNDHLRTTNRRIYAAGDVCSRHKFTHAADALARIVVQNALFFGRRRVSRLVVPWCTFTSPEVAHVGLTLTEAEKRGADTITIPLSSVDRAVVDEATSGFVRLHHEGGRIVGATIVSPAAGELIGAVAMAMQSGQSLGDLASVIFPYPTLSIALRQAGDAYRRSRLTPFVRTALRYYFHASS